MPEYECNKCGAENSERFGGPPSFILGQAFCPRCYPAEMQEWVHFLEKFLPRITADYIHQQTATFQHNLKRANREQLNIWVEETGEGHAEIHIYIPSYASAKLDVGFGSKSGLPSITITRDGIRIFDI